ncbi:uncharacterized protein LOC133372434 isoform X2 [Rhineura floridana]|uniref:uncharacterized protein LOC133372434 isoform X2 n=1 Tax=Rhineura floridana TaxID=261503 RepID=UPI002AC854F6|nr:uncharacterized protein LOC133372434 isoform X2 [Rhineura floridana]
MVEQGRGNGVTKVCVGVGNTGIDDKGSEAVEGTGNQKETLERNVTELPREKEVPRQKGEHYQGGGERLPQCPQQQQRRQQGQDEHFGQGEQPGQGHTETPPERVLSEKTIPTTNIQIAPSEGEARGGRGVTSGPSPNTNEKTTDSRKGSRPGRSYAAAAGGRTGTTPRGTWGRSDGSMRGPPLGSNFGFGFDLETEMLEDARFLDEFYSRVAREPDLRERFVVRLRYRGNDLNLLTCDYVVKEILLGRLGIGKEQLLAVITPPGLTEVDICLASERSYQVFWERCRTVRRLGGRCLEDFDVVPLFRGENKVVTISFRTTGVPQEDVGAWLK